MLSGGLADSFPQARSLQRPEVIVMKRLALILFCISACRQAWAGEQAQSAPSMEELRAKTIEVLSLAEQLEFSKASYNCSYAVTLFDIDLVKYESLAKEVSSGFYSEHKEDRQKTQEVLEALGKQVSPLRVYSSVGVMDDMTLYSTRWKLMSSAWAILSPNDNRVQEFHEAMSKDADEIQKTSAELFHLGFQYIGDTDTIIKPVKQK
jgi:hypothetical protein